MPRAANLFYCPKNSTCHLPYHRLNYWNMKSKKIKWLIYTVLVGVIPIVARMLMWLVAKEGTLTFLSAGDFIAFGLVLHISNVNEVEHLKSEGDWKTIQNGISIAFIAFYSILFCLSLLGEKIVKVDSITICSMVLSFISLLLGFSVYFHLSAVESSQGGIS